MKQWPYLLSGHGASELHPADWGFGVIVKLYSL